MKYFTDKEMQDLQNADKKILQDNWNKISVDNQKIISDTYTKTKKFGGWQDNSKLQGFEGFDKETQIGIPGVNMVKTQEQSQNIQKPEIGESYRYETPKTEIKGLDYVKFKDEPSGNLDLTYDNFQNIYRKQARGEKLGIAEQNFLTDLKLKSQFEGKTMQEIFGIETKADKERKYQNLAMENRNLNSGDLRNTLASQGLNYDEIEKVIGYHQPYNEYLQTQNELKARSDEAFSKKKELLDKQLAETTHQIQENGKQRMDVLNTGISFSGFGRSSYALGRRDEVARSVNAEISIAQSKAQAELELYQAQLQGADEQTLGVLSQNLANYTNALKNQQTENAKLAQALNDEANASMSQALDNMIALSGVNENAIDKELSKELGYLVNSKGQAVNVDENGKPIMLLSGRKQAYEEGKDKRDFEYNSGKDERDFQYGIYKDNRDFEYGAYKDERDFGLKQAEFSHQASMDSAGLKLDYEKLGLERDKYEYGIAKDNVELGLKEKELDYKMNEADIKQAKQDKIDLQNAIYGAEDAKTMMDEFETLKGSWQTDRLLPSMSAKIDRLKTSLAFMEVQNLKAKGISMTPMTDADFNNIKNSVSSLTTSMSPAEYTKEIERIQGVLKKGVDRNVGKYGKQFDFDTGEVLNIGNGKENTGSGKRNFSDRDINSMFNGNYVERKELTKSQKLKISNHFSKNNQNFKEADQTAQIKAIPKKAMALGLENTRKSGQCGAFVNDYCQKLGIGRIMGDSYASKQKHINSKIPQVGGVAVWNPGGKFGSYGHTGVVTGVGKDYVIIRDANWKGDEVVRTRKVAIASILNGQNGGFVNFS